MNSKFLLTQCNFVTAASLLRQVFLVSILIVLSACGGGGISSADGGEDLTSPLPGGIGEGGLLPGEPGQQPTAPNELALLPQVAVNARQIADPDVLIRLQGSVAAAEGAEIVQTLWVQVLGPSVVIEDPQSLQQLVQVPDVTSALLLQFRLTAVDSEGRVNSASIAVVVRPVVDQPGVPEEKLVQVLQFLEPGPFQIEEGNSFSNSLDTSAAPQGIGAVTYESSNPSVASVDANGLVTALAEGTTEITATRAEDNVYLAASDTYEIVVIPPAIEPVPASLDFDAFIGASDTQFNFKYPVTGYEFLRTNSADCSPFNGCTELLSDVLDSPNVVDNPSLSTTGYFWLAANDQTSLDVIVDGSTRGIRADQPPARGSHGLVATADRLWLLGGLVVSQFEEFEAFYDVWSSADGVSWQLETEQLVEEQDVSLESSFSVNQSVVFGDAIWLTVDTEQGSTVVYHSADGVQWTLETQKFQPEHKMTVFQDRLLVYETFFDASAGNITQVWEYIEGIGWSAEPQTVTFSSLLYKSFVEYNGSLWMFTGDTGEQAPIWSSTDGVTWTAIQPDINELFTGLEVQVVELNGELWLFSDTGAIFRSTDAQAWTPVEPDTTLLPINTRVAVFENKLWLHGGLDFGNNEGEITQQDTWVSSDGISWRKVFHGVVFFEEQSQPLPL